MLDEMQVRGHSEVSGSKMKRFLICPISYRPDERDVVDNSPKTAAIEGERAHDIAERMAWGEVVEVGEEEDVTPSMVRGGELYRDAIASCVEEHEADGAVLKTEQHVSMGEHFSSTPDNLGGYYDAMVVWRGGVHVFDYKFGRHIVDPDTPQLTFYIVAMLLTMARRKGVRDLDTPASICEWLRENCGDFSFEQTIVQPKNIAEPVRTYAITIDEICAFVESLDAAMSVWLNNPVFNEELANGNIHACKWCEKRTFCTRSVCRPSDYFLTPEECQFKFDPKDEG